MKTRILESLRGRRVAWTATASILLIFLLPWTGWLPILLIWLCNLGLLYRDNRQSKWRFVYAALLVLAAALLLWNIVILFV